MNYEKLISEVRRRAGPISRDEAEVVTGAYLETLRELLSGDLPGKLAAHLPDRLAERLEGEGGGEEYPVWAFYERLSQKAGIAPEHATRYARHVGSVLGDAVPEDALDEAREDLPPEYWELAERVLPDPHYHGSFERRPSFLRPSVPNEVLISEEAL